MARLLFVDDEVRVLSGLRRQLHGRGDGAWECHFVPGGEEALAWLADQACDVLITDMRMPVVDGAQVLAATAAACPGAARLVLSGQTECADVVAAGAHHVLDKPCDRQVLELELQQALTMEAARHAAAPGLAALWEAPARRRPGLERLLAAAVEEPAARLDAVAARLAEDDEQRRRLLGLLAALLPEQVSPRDRPELALARAGTPLALGAALALEVLAVADPEGWDRGWHPACAAAGAETDDEARARVLVAGLLAHLQDEQGLLAWLLPAWGLDPTVLSAWADKRGSTRPSPGPIAGS